MQWHEHWKLQGKHALLSASQHSWLNYDEEKLRNHIHSIRAKELGTKKHALAAQLIDMRVNLPETEETLNMYVNDGIYYGMRTEQLLYYSDYIFGTADTITFYNDGQNWILRVHDYKSGEREASMDQLHIYASLFCLEYDIDPSEIIIICRIYQNNEINQSIPGVDVIRPIMDKIVSNDMIIKQEMEETIYVM